MSNKRFEIVYLRGLDYMCSIQDHAEEIQTFYNDLSYYCGAVKPLCDLMNELDEKCVFYSRIIDYFVFLLNYPSREIFLEEMEKTLDKWEELR